MATDVAAAMPTGIPRFVSRYQHLADADRNKPREKRAAAGEKDLRASLKSKYAKTKMKPEVSLS